MRFRTFLKEGGNVVLKTGEAAQKIPMDQVERKELQKVLRDTLVALNKKFEAKFDHPLWKNFDELVRKEMLYSGSSRIFFKDSVSDEEFKKYKSKVGDLDLMFPLHLKGELKQLLDSIIGQQVGPCRYVDEGGNSPSQYNTLFELPEEYWDKIKYVQVDFEPVDANEETGEPTEFSLFAHYSSWKDIQEGVKGLFSKYLYRSIFSNIEKISNYVILTDSGKVSKSKEFESEIGKYKFSVDRGVRIGYVPVMDADGTQKMVDGKFAYKKDDKSNYEQGMQVIFNMAYQKDPTDSELKAMHSFVGSLDLIAQNFDKAKIENIFVRFIELIWGQGAQGIERDNPKGDFEIKKTAYDLFLKKFPYLKSHDKQIQQELKVFYEKY